MKRMIWSISWKNIWRNKVRSLVVITSIILGMLGGVLSVGLMMGLIQQRIDASVENEVSHVQIHHSEFMNNEEIQYTIDDFNRIKTVLDTLSEVKAYTTRSKSYAMVQSSWAATGLAIKGIELENEKKVSNLNEKIIEGNYFEKTSRLPSIVIGSKAAENLKLLNYQITEEKKADLDSLKIPKSITNKLDSIADKRYRTEKQFKKALASVLTQKEIEQFEKKLVKHFSFYRLRAKVTVTLSDTAQNILPITYRVAGIYKTTNSMFDGLNAFVLKESIQKETGFTDDFIHEIAIMSGSEEAGVQLAKKLKAILPEYSVLSWKKTAPDLAYMSDMMGFIDVFYIGIIMFALAFGIINTMLMAVLERAKELGMLMAIGMNKLRVFSMIMLESVMLTLTGALIGMGLSGIILAIYSDSGFNFTSWAEGFEALGYSALIYPEVSTENFIRIIILVIVTGIIASIWPARKALKMNPAEALRTD